ncbi:MAG: phage virion morphogenesis protein [Proteobacteria bacterium]|nr:phage virion morphogenesis protein [Pseudomonadota bacterium]
MIDIQIDVSDFTELEEELEAFGKKLDLSSQILSEVATDQLARIKTRTLAGKSFEGDPFDPYSDSYSAFRTKKGRATDKVDLFFSGHMFGAMDYEIIDDGVRLYFNDVLQAAKAHGLYYGYIPNQLPARPFFELSADDEVKIQKQIDDAVNEIRGIYFS